uniref:dethiobiotin synthase n=1 Tax=Synechococcus sp. UW106 TaxID=368495 RepID=UPI0010BDD8CC|nr:dethiobiotin synthase [Synechococcus sp. UW106]
MKNPEIYWVIAAGTNFGKTTITTALIRTLNLLGTPAVGFKPVAGCELSEAHCFIEKYSQYNSELSGNDSRKLCEASPLTNRDMVDIVNPHYLIFKQHPLRPVFWRIGSRHLENFSYFKGENYDNCMKDNTHRRVISNSSMPITGAQYVNTVDSSEQIEAAYQALLRLEPNAMVFEGAGRLLPVWGRNNGASIFANHLIIITRGKLNFIRGINFRAQQRDNRIMPLAYLVNQINFSQQKVLSLPINKVQPDQLESYSDSLIQKLLNC